MNERTLAGTSGHARVAWGLLVAVGIASLTATTEAQTSSIACGLPPLPPLGCSMDRKSCVCWTDGDGKDHCRWFFFDCR
jgi:hypothetical protein